MFEILTGFGNAGIQKALIAELPSHITIIGKDAEWQGEAINMVQEHKGAEVILLYTGINGNMDKYGFVEKITKYTNAEILLIDDENEKEFREYCFKFGITKVVTNGKVKVGMLIELICDIYKMKEAKNKIEKKVDIVDLEPEYMHADTAEKQNATEKIVEVEKIVEIEKVVEKVVHIVYDRILGTKTIGVMGVKSGSGTTGAAIDICMMLHGLGNFKVAIIEINDSGDLEFMKKNKNIDYYAGNVITGIVASQKYDYVVIDFSSFSDFLFGEIKQGNLHTTKQQKEEYFRCDIRIMVCSGEPWNIQKLQSILENEILTEALHNIKFFITGGFRRDLIEPDKGKLLKIEQNADEYLYKTNTLKSEEKVKKVCEADENDYIKEYKRIYHFIHEYASFNINLYNKANIYRALYMVMPHKTKRNKIFHSEIEEGSL